MPSTMPACVRLGSVASVPRKRAMPKSRILTVPSRVSRMLAGLTSRWMTPILCAKSSPRQMSTVTRAFCSTVKRSIGTIASPRSMPSTYSMAM